MTTSTTLPAWFKQKTPDVEKIQNLKESFRAARLHTVCESAHCPNIGECWGRGAATFMILGDTCTRSCGFCAVYSGKPSPVDYNEPHNLALMVKSMDLNYAVITSVTRDDLPDGGAGHFAKTISEIKDIAPKTKIEVLIPDFFAEPDNLKTVVDAQPHVIAHNIETVYRLSAKVRPQADYRRSLSALQIIKQLNPAMITKSGFMVGMGETFTEIKKLMKDLRDVGCDILTVGQYLSPSRDNRHIPVMRYITPEEFETYRDIGLSAGFKYVASGPLVRSSYLAEDSYKECVCH